MGTRHEMAGHSFLGGWLICLLFTDKTESNARKRTQDTKYPSAPPAPNWALASAYFSCLLAHVLEPCMVLHVFFNSAKYRHCSFNFRTIFVLQQVSCYNYLYLNNIQSQKVKPCGRTTLFSAGLQCQIHKGRQTVLDGGGVFRVSRKEPCQQPMSSINLEWSR